MKNEHEFSNVNQYTIALLTWNLAGNPPAADLSFDDVIKSKKITENPDIFIMGFQETLPLNAINILKGHDKERVEALIDMALYCLND